MDTSWSRVLELRPTFSQAIGCATSAQLFNGNRAWLLNQGKNSTNALTGQYWDILSDTTAAVPDGTSANLSGSSLTTQSAQAMANANAQAIFTGGAAPIDYTQHYWGAPNSVGSAFNGTTYQASTTRANAWSWVNTSGDFLLTISTSAGSDAVHVSVPTTIYNGLSGCPSFGVFCVGTSGAMWSDQNGNWHFVSIGISGCGGGTYVKADKHWVRHAGRNNARCEHH